MEKNSKLAKIMKTTWQTKRLGEVCDIVNGFTPSRNNKLFWDNGDVSWFTIGDIRKQGRVITYTNQKITRKALGKNSDRILPPESVLLCCTASVGEYAIAKIPITTNQQFNGLVIRDRALLDPSFLFYFSSTLTAQLLGLSGKTTIDFISVKKLREIEISLPPLIEQKRIVNILDEVFENIEKAKENAEKNLKNSKEIFESYLQNFFANSGEDWEEKNIGEICDLMTGGTPSRNKKEYFENGEIRWLVSGDVNLGQIFDCEGRITELGMKNSNAKYLPIDSIIIALNGQGKTRGAVAMLRTKATCNQSLVNIYPKKSNEIISEYIFYNLKVRYQEIRRITGDDGNDRRGLNMLLIRNIKIPFPKSINEQEKIVLKFKDLLEQTKKLERIYNQKLADLEELKKSVLKKSFTGQL